MLFGKRGKSGLVALNLDLDQVADFVQQRLGKEVEMGGCKGPITTFIIEPFIPHDQEFYLNIVSERLGCSISFSECGGIEIEENWDKVLLLHGNFRSTVLFEFLTLLLHNLQCELWLLDRLKLYLFQQGQRLRLKFVLHLLRPFLWR